MKQRFNRFIVMESVHCAKRHCCFDEQNAFRTEKMYKQWNYR